MRDQELEHLLAQLVLLRRELVRRVLHDPWTEDHREVCRDTGVRKGEAQEETGGHVLFAVMRFLSHLRAKTDRRSSTYRSRYWFARGIEEIKRLYVAITSSWIYGCLAAEIYQYECRAPETQGGHLLRLETIHARQQL